MSRRSRISSYLVVLLLIPSSRAGGTQLFDTEAFNLVSWKKSLGAGHSGIAVADGRVLTMFSDGEYLYGFSALPGRVIWQEYGGSLTADYAEMLVEELVPVLDEKYRTIPRADSRAIVGNFRGAVAALYAAYHHHDVFGKVAIQSPALRYLPPVSDEVLSLFRNQEKQPLQFYVGWNRYDFRGTGFDIREDSREFADLLREKGYAVAGGEAPGCFGWGSWRARTGEILESLFPFSAN